MFIYIILLLIAILLLFNKHSELYLQKFSRIAVVVIISLLFFVLCVFRSTDIGADYKMYYRMFDMFTYDDMISHSIEPGFAKLVTYAQTNNNFLIIPIFVFTLGYISILLLEKQINVNSFELISFTILTGIYLLSFSILRQIIAMSIIYIGVYFLLKFHDSIFLKYLLFIICVIIAFKFHRTAIFGLIFLFVPKVSYGKKTVIIMGVITTILYFSNIMKTFFNKLLLLFPNYIGKYQNGSAISSQSPVSLIVDSIPMIIQFIFLYIFISNYQYKGKSNYNVKFILTGYLLYLLLFSAFGNSIARRFQIYTFMFPFFYSCFFIGNINYNKSDVLVNKCSVITKVCFVLFWLIFFVLKLVGNQAHLIPYSLI